jgi:hypothetical protein
MTLARLPSCVDQTSKCERHPYIEVLREGLGLGIVSLTAAIQTDAFGARTAEDRTGGQSQVSTLAAEKPIPAGLKCHEFEMTVVHAIRAADTLVSFVFRPIHTASTVEPRAGILLHFAGL